ncbi:MAG: pyruvate dehydrogenase (acetyl-transferring), homodimeric type [Gammaproteobacteria bacterium]|nr:pyruvate dehydrogenase (acetyl-transferring), homodimeric type [Gammaproteobacteria bacterium]
MSEQKNQFDDVDPIETQEWLSALDSVMSFESTERAKFLIQKLFHRLKQRDPDMDFSLNTPYRNSIPIELEAKMPNGSDIAARILSFIRWNAVAMVLHGGKTAPELGGHIATYASAAILYEVGFNYFFKGRNDNNLGDLLYIQGHSAPGIYARAFLEGRLSEENLMNFRQEVHGDGLSSYPHPWLMPDFWQFPTVSMGLGPLQAIYQARFLKYLENRKLVADQQRKVWCFCGDGEMDEPESLGALTVASREKLDNLIFVINCNLQRLDGPVRGNGKIIQELESLFRGAGWNVIKVIWGSRWDTLLAKDKTGLLQKRMDEAVDGEYQNYKANDGAYVRKHFFGKYPELLELVKDMSDDDIWHLNRGGHDPQKVYAAYAAATKHTGQPTVILAKTIKGYGMGAAGEGMNITHQQKKMSIEHLKTFCDRFSIPISADKIESLPFYRPEEGSPEYKFIHQQRQALGGYLPKRYSQSPQLLIPALETFEPLLKNSGDREISTTMAFVRVLTILLKDKNIAANIVPIVPDECRTFGMEGLFRQIGIYSPLGQLYDPVDKDQVMFYREAKDGQLLEEGITEGGAFASWMAAATSYSTNGLPLIPFYIYYSMFGFQRVGDLAWAAGDMRARGFLLGGTAGRTTLAGEGLQHTDGHSHIFSSVIPNCVSYDPSFAYEVAVIIQHGLKRMFQDQEDVFYYITLMNENYYQPDMPTKVEEGIIKGMYLFQPGKKADVRVQLLGAGTILREVISASELLEKDFGISADVWSVPSFTELRREGLNIARENLLHPEQSPKIPYVTQCLRDKSGPVIAATDYMRLFADQIREFIEQPYYVLGTDGFGRSDTRRALRWYFEVDAKFIAYTAIKALADENKVSAEIVAKAIQLYDINPEKINPMTA